MEVPRKRATGGRNAKGGNPYVSGSAKRGSALEKSAGNVGSKKDVVAGLLSEARYRVSEYEQLHDALISLKKERDDAKEQADKAKSLNQDLSKELDQMMRELHQLRLERTNWQCRIWLEGVEGRSTILAAPDEAEVDRKSQPSVGSSAAQRGMASEAAISRSEAAEDTPEAQPAVPVRDQSLMVPEKERVSPGPMGALPGRVRQVSEDSARAPEAQGKLEPDSASGCHLEEDEVCGKLKRSLQDALDAAAQQRKSGCAQLQQEAVAARASVGDALAVLQAVHCLLQSGSPWPPWLAAEMDAVKQLAGTATATAAAARQEVAACMRQGQQDAQRLRDDVAELRTLRDGLEERLAQCGRDHDALQAQLAEAVQDAERYRKDRADAQTETLRLREDVRRAEEGARAARLECEQLSGSCRSLQENRRQLAGKLEAAQAQVKALQGQLQNGSDHTATLLEEWEQHRRSLQQQLQQQQQAAEQLQARLQSSSAAQAAADAQIAELRSCLAAAEQRQAQQEEAVRQAAQQLEEVAGLRDRMTVDLAREQRRYSTLKGELDAERRCSQAQREQLALAVQQAEARAAGAEEEQGRLRKQLEAAERLRDEVQAAARQQLGEVARLQDDREGLLGEVESLRKQLVEAGAREMLLQQQLQQLSDAAAEMQSSREMERQAGQQVGRGSGLDAATQTAESPSTEMQTTETQTTATSTGDDSPGCCTGKPGAASSGTTGGPEQQSCRSVPGLAAEECIRLHGEVVSLQGSHHKLRSIVRETQARFSQTLARAMSAAEKRFRDQEGRAQEAAQHLQEQLAAAENRVQLLRWEGQQKDGLIQDMCAQARHVQQQLKAQQAVIEKLQRCCTHHGEGLQGSRDVSLHIKPATR